MIGALHAPIARQIQSLYEPLNFPVLITTPRTAEFIKYAANAFLATKYLFINEISQFVRIHRCPCQRGVCSTRNGSPDRRVFSERRSRLRGACFPKDIQALLHIAGNHGKS
ncbi:hypothetical protein WMW72_26605 [Paenibacillus filicis]|uniref:UDP-glucose 6-dehydrogenase n=1 Tax=Paenibacillus filicis TaxID=669464 RepID=A0ABU9DRH8_9BACL